MDAGDATKTSILTMINVTNSVIKFGEDSSNRFWDFNISKLFLRGDELQLPVIQAKITKLEPFEQT